MERTQASAAIQALPKRAGGDEKELLRVVDAVIDYISKQGCRYFVGPFETTIEGDAETLWKILKGAEEVCYQEGSDEVALYIKFASNRKKGVLGIEEKTSKFAGRF
ncbi:MAG: thiamine-binding protein [Spirochaetaceae bacterium]|jgi:uncharacterized protein YqgV (UPF0045/DUF77 family)|nr:thiamine-binding protein [Spirochaetaceae bacterium]